MGCYNAFVLNERQNKFVRKTTRIYPVFFRDYFSVSLFSLLIRIRYVFIFTWLSRFITFSSARLMVYFLALLSVHTAIIRAYCCWVCFLGSTQHSIIVIIIIVLGKTVFIYLYFFSGKQRIKQTNIYVYAHFIFDGWGSIDNNIVSCHDKNLSSAVMQFFFVFEGNSIRRATTIIVSLPNLRFGFSPFSILFLNL